MVINTEDPTTGKLGINEYMGLGYLKSYMQQQGTEVKIMTLPYNSNSALNVEQIIKNKPSIVGFSTYIDNINETLKVCSKIKQSDPNPFIVLGGPQVNTFEKKILEDNPFVDGIMSYEGEETLKELHEHLCTDRDLYQCRGLTFRSSSGAIIQNEYRQPIKNLDSLPFPSRDIHENVAQKFMYVSGSRGCLGGCSFCSETSTKKIINPPYVRLRSAKSIADEFEYLMRKYKVNSFRLTDATFEDPGKEGFQRANELFDEILKRKLDVSLHLFTRAELVNSEPDSYFIKAKEAGTECFYIGIESGNSSDLKLYHKRTTVVKNYNAIKRVEKFGIHAAIGFINFNPLSTFEKLKENASFLKSVGKDHVFYLLQTRLEVLPNAPIKNQLQDEGIIDNFTYSSHFYDYRFRDPAVSLFFDVIKKAYTEPPIYYMDTLLGMDYTWVCRNLTDEKKSRIINLFDELYRLNDEYRNYNMLFYETCLDMCANGAKHEQLDKLIRQFDLNKMYKPYTDIYNKINTRVTKERLRKFI